MLFETVLYRVPVPQVVHDPHICLASGCPCKTILISVASNVSYCSKASARRLCSFDRDWMIFFARSYASCKDKTRME
jgi:hypothetical protein